MIHFLSIQRDSTATAESGRIFFSQSAPAPLRSVIAPIVCVWLGNQLSFSSWLRPRFTHFFYQRRRLFYLGSGLYLFDDIREAGSFAGCVYGFSAFTNDDDEWRQKVLLDLRGLARHLRRLWVLKHGIGWMVSFLILRYGCLYMHRKNAGDVSGGGSFFSNAVTIPWIFYYTISSLSCILVWR